ncbi:nucleoside 2-deoxyribosyltransferase [Anaerosphaera multitolerans]|uniref:Nucleoside 2-deoxyribosyltransferase n=1 Tax=Anaerosphaera multitolerans TaxID=2487351 RepID=A0A437SA58_9FIRM|nr:nucleoside 2-deoxyribosyltransferase [Anaerosphaera multitolerans]RVU55697.1 nucleoside 2-deoxyribosyltransferase [Anaerosphaera multitolerans]
MKKFTGYFASHFFNAGMFEWTEKVAQRIESETGIDLYVPQRNGEINDKKNNDDIITDIAISKADTAQLKKANILIACLDGLTIDDGVAAEIMAHGVMAEIEEEYNINKDFPRMIIGIITDMRYHGTGDNHLYRNLMIIGKVREHGHLVVGYPGDDSYIDEIIKHIKNFIAKN